MIAPAAPDVWRPAVPDITLVQPLPAVASPVRSVSGITDARPPRGITCHQPPWARRASAAALLALARWVTPHLPLYGNDHDRSDFAP